METAMMNSICRCCATEGVFKCVTIAYTWMGEEEIYADMLKECFDINLNLSESGEDGGICEVCITQLRNASNFKKQVLSTEEQLKKHAENKLFKPNIVKVEVTRNDDDSDDNMSAEEAYSGPEFEVPIKTETEESKPKKRTMATRASTSGAKKSKDDDAGETSTKRIDCKSEIKISRKVSKQKLNKKQLTAKKNDDLMVTMVKRILNPKVAVKADSDVREISKHLHNARTILLYSNATPIRSYNGIGYVCGFCPQSFKLSDLKTHTLQEHDNTEKKRFMEGCCMSKYIVKLDVTDLKCDICDESMENLQKLVSHLQTDHGKTYHSDINDHILPIKRDSDGFICVICSKTFQQFKVMVGHMNIHYRNNICKICDSGFVSRLRHKVHLNPHKQGEYTCGFCTKVFDTEAKMSHHEKIVHIKDYRRNKCPYCNKRFLCYFKKTEHMVQEHGAESLVLKCRACDKTFTRKAQLTNHIKRDHLLEKKYECDHCDMKFFVKKNLDYHMVKHTGLKPYQCDFCSKQFVKRESLKEHLLRVHSDDSKFECEHCGQIFVQEYGWRRHMRSEHGEIL